MTLKFMRLLGLAILLFAIFFWLSRGANRGWSKSQVPRQQTDPVTGLVGVSWEQRFVPGLDFLGGSVAVSAALIGISFLRRRSASQG